MLNRDLFEENLNCQQSKQSNSRFDFASFTSCQLICLVTFSVLSSLSFYCIVHSPRDFSNNMLTTFYFVIIVFSNRDAASGCGTCIETPGCGFCASNLTCVSGDESGPTDGSCDSWTTEASTCPELPLCRMQKACSTCVEYDGCSWCQSLDECMPSSETSFVQCQGRVDFEGFCPNSFTETTRVGGNLIVEGDTDRMGGGIHISGPCNKGKTMIHFVDGQNRHSFC